MAPSNGDGRHWREPQCGRTGSPQGHRQARDRNGVESNARLTASTGAVLFVLLAAEGVTILRIQGLLSAHVFIGMLLVPPVLLKMASTSYRFFRYYTGAPPYRHKGAPPFVLRFLGPLVVVLTVVVLASGVALLLAGSTWRSSLLFLHKASFVLWFGAMTVHVLGHLVDTAALAPRDWIGRTRRDVVGTGLRQWAVVISLVVGVLAGLMLVAHVGPWLASTGRGGS